MASREPGAKVLLIGGTSHVGKSTLASRMAETLGWDLLSTDQLARHPGRPWRNDGEVLPADVVAYYTQPDASRILATVLAHYSKNVGPIVNAIINSRVKNDYDRGLVLEGSAILPEQFATNLPPEVLSCWLTAPEEMIEQRIKTNAAYEHRSDHERRYIDAFVVRSLDFDRLMVSAVPDQALIDISIQEAADVVASRVKGYRSGG